MSTPPAVGSWKRASSAAKVDLPARPPDDRDVLSGGDVEGDVAQRDRLGVVGEAHVVEVEDTLRPRPVVRPRHLDELVVRAHTPAMRSPPAVARINRARSWPTARMRGTTSRVRVHDDEVAGREHAPATRKTPSTSTTAVVMAPVRSSSVPVDGLRSRCVAMSATRGGE